MSGYIDSSRLLPNGELSQSMTKELGLFVIDDTIVTTMFCPKRFYYKYMTKEYKETTSLAMKHGLYFETRILGKGAKGNNMSSLKLNKNGTKKAANKRIDRQADRLYGYMYAHGVRLNKYNRQVLLFAEHDAGVILRGEMDIFPVHINGKPVIIDIKSTGSIHNTFFSRKEDWIRMTSSSCWGDFPSIAKNQPLIYHYIARNFLSFGLEQTIDLVPERESQYNLLFEECDLIELDDTGFIFMVAGIGKKDISDQLVHYSYPYNRESEMLLDELVSESILRAEEAALSGYEPRGCKVLCRSCPMKDICSGAVLTD